MRRLPLFPLPTVLLPGAPMPLHVFEPRYRQMVARCVEGDGRFGLIYHDPDRHGPFTTDPGRVGTIAEIVKFQPLPDGRSLILCRGEERFTIEDGIESETAYYEAVVEPYDDAPAAGDDEPDELAARRARSMELFLHVLNEIVGQPPPLLDTEVRGDMAFYIARAIKIDPAWQQHLLERRTERERLDIVDSLLEAVIAAHERGEWPLGDDDAEA